MTDGLDLYLLLQELWRRLGAADKKDRQRTEKEGLIRNAPHKKEVDVVASVESEQKCAEGPMAAEQIAETAKTESEILHLQLQERNAFFDVDTTVDVEAERWRERCREEMAAAREIEEMLNDWIDKLDGKAKKCGAKKPQKGPKKPEKRAKPVLPACEGKEGTNEQLVPPELPQDQIQEDISGGDKGEAVVVSAVASKKAKRKAAKKEKKEGRK
jgi:hypothetical protein